LKPKDIFSSAVVELLRAAFQPAVSVQELVTKLSSSDKSENSTLISVIKHLREKMWERVLTETDML
jgi:hypothetical protein